MIWPDSFDLSFTCFLLLCTLNNVDSCLFCNFTLQLFFSFSRTCLRSLKACSGWWMTFATTDCVIVACPLAPSSYSTMTAWTTLHINSDLQGLPVLTTLPNTPSPNSALVHVFKEIGRIKTHGWVIGSWGCCWYFSLISTVEGWRVIIFWKQRPPYVLPMIFWQEM